MAKPTLCLDFDGVIHGFTSGWKGAAAIPDPPVPGAMEFIAAAIEHFQVDIFSSRSADPLGRRAMWSYIKKHLEEAIGEIEASRVISMIDFPFDKPPAFVSIDDRALTFEGKWPDIDKLLTFKPWNKRPKSDAAGGRTVTDILCLANAAGEIGYVDSNSRKAGDDYFLVQESLTRGLIRFLRYENVPGKTTVEPSDEAIDPAAMVYRRSSIYELTKRGAAFLAAELRKARA